MKKFGKILLIGLGFGLVTAGLGFLTSNPTPAQLPPPSVPVKVTNTPLPVQGTVSISNTVPVAGTVNAYVTNSVLPVSGAVTATIANTPVPITGAVTADFSNTSSTPLFADTDGPARSGFGASCFVQFPIPGNQETCVIANVPNGKTLVVETISCFADVPQGGDAPLMTLFVASTPISGGPAALVYYYLALPKVSTITGSDQYAITTPVRIYAAPGGFVSLSASGASGPNLIAGANCAISGHLVNP